MPTATIDGIATNFDVIGSGPPLLMYSPGGFDARMEKWRTLGVYERIKLLDHLPDLFTCIVYDRRETGYSGGRVERVTWDDFVKQGKGLLNHLGHEKAHLLGGCMGCSPLLRFSVMHPEMVMSMVLYWPVGGAKYRLNAFQRFSTHLAYVHEHGLQSVVDLVKSHDKSFGQDPRGGPWAAPVRNNLAFARDYATLDVNRYKLIVSSMYRTLFDRDTAPGAEPEDLMQLSLPTLIVPGADGSHATSAARYLEECIPGAEYWDVSPEEQTEENSPNRVMEFLQRSANST